MFGQEYGVRHGSLELREVRDYRLEGLRAEVRTKLGQVALLIGPGPFETGNEVAKQLQPAIETALVSSASMIGAQAELRLCIEDVLDALPKVFTDEQKSSSVTVPSRANGLSVTARAA